ncbi:MAG: alpha/beta hydrolase [Gammaproteobacteria bacterium]|nr:alpha/beta hydrolase [Gammaproteobacteria bacterium]
MLKNIIVILLIVYAALNVVTWLASNRMIFLPPHPGYQDSNQIIKLHTKDGATISAIYLPNKKAKYTLLVSHGNAEDIGYMLPFLQQLHQHNFAVFAYDYEGYGTSTGKPTEKHTYQNINAAYKYLTTNLKIPANHIIAYGTSIGAAAAIDLASRKKVVAVIARSPFVSAFRVITHFKILPFDKFENIKKITKINCPVLFIHGTADNIVPIWHSKELYKKAKQPKSHYWVENAGHNNLISVAGNNFWQAIKQLEKTLDNFTH